MWNPRMAGHRRIPQSWSIPKSHTLWPSLRLWLTWRVGSVGPYGAAFRKCGDGGGAAGGDQGTPGIPLRQPPGQLAWRATREAGNSHGGQLARPATREVGKLPAPALPPDARAAGATANWPPPSPNRAFRLGQPHRWPIDVVRAGRATATMGHRCRGSSIYGPPLRLPALAEQHRWPIVAVAAGGGRRNAR